MSFEFVASSRIRSRTGMPNRSRKGVVQQAGAGWWRRRGEFKRQFDLHRTRRRPLADDEDRAKIPPWQEYRFSSTAGLSGGSSSMKSTSRLFQIGQLAARSPGPIRDDGWREVRAENSHEFARTICARCLLPSPGAERRAHDQAPRPRGLRRADEHWRFARARPSGR